MTTTVQPQETTARIKRDELLRLLNVTSPVGYQAITARTRIDDIQAELARTAEPPAEIVSVPVADVPPPAELAPGSKRTYARPFSQVAALLPAVERPRAPRTTGRLPVLRARTAPPVRERLDRGEDLAATPWISARVASHLTAEEVAMLPMELRLRLPAVADWAAPPRIELTPMPGLPCIDLHPVPAQAPVEVTDRMRDAEPEPARIATIAISAAFVMLGACAVYAVL